VENGQMAQGQAPAQGQGKPGFGELVSSVYQGMSMVSEILAASKKEPEIAQQMVALQDAFAQLVDKLTGAGGEEDEGQEMSPKAPSQPQDAMAGASGVPVA